MKNYKKTKKQLIKELEELEEKYRFLEKIKGKRCLHLFHTSGDAIMLLDEDGFLDCNLSALRIFGCKNREEFCSKHPADFSPAKQPDGKSSMVMAQEKIDLACREGTQFFEWIHRREDGEDFPAEVLLSAMDWDGRRILQATVRDITERKKMEEKLLKYHNSLEELVDKRTEDLKVANEKLQKEIEERQKTQELLTVSETRNRALLKAVPDLIFLQSRDGVYLDYNVPSTFRFPPEHFLYKTMDKVLPPQIAAGAKKVFNKVRITGKIQVFEYSLPVEGETHYYEARIVPYERDYVVSIVRNITARKEAELQRETAKKSLEHRLAMEKLVSTISTRFINLTTSEIDTEIKKALNSILEFEKIDRCYIALFSNDGLCVEKIYEAYGKGLKARFEGLEGQPRRKISWLLEKLSTFEVLNIPCIEDLPGEGGKEKEVLKAGGVKSILAIPLVLSKRLIGLMGFQKEKEEKTWSEEDIRLLKLVGEIFTGIVERRKGEELLKYRLEMEELVSAISSRFINLGSKDIEREIKSSLSIIREFEKADRSYLLVYSADELRVEEIYESYSKKVRKKAHKYVGRELDYSSWIMKKFSKFENVNIPSTFNMPDDLKREKAIWIKTGVKSMLAIPLTLNKKLIGCFGFQSETEEKSWNEEDIKLLKLLGEIFINVLKRKKAEALLQHRLEMEELVSSISTRFINLSFLEIDREIDRALDNIMKFEKVDRCYLYLFSEDGKRAEKIYEVYPKGLKSKIKRFDGKEIKNKSWAIEKLQNFEIVNISDIEDLPSELEWERGVFQKTKVKSILAIPLAMNKNLIGFLGLQAEKKSKSWQEEDIKLLKLAGEIFVNVLLRKKAEQSIKQRLSMEKMVSMVSTRFINLKPEELDRDINITLQAIGTFIGVDRCFIYLFSGDGKTLDMGYEWFKDELEGRVKENLNYSVEDFKWSMEILKSFNHIHISSIDELPPEAEKERREWAKRGIHAVLAFPMILGKKLIGYVGFTSEKKERVWKEEDIRLLKMVVEIFMNALERKRADKELGIAHDELEKRVKERTAELVSLNKKLSKEIEERKWIETILRNSEHDFRELSQQFKTLLDAISEPLLLLNTDLNVKWRNSSASSLFKSNEVDIYLKYCKDLDPACPCKRSFKSGREEVARFAYNERLFEVKSFPVKEEEKVINVIAMFVDITEKVNIEAETIRISQLASIGELAAGVAHEINNPITGIISWGDYLIDEFEKDSPEYDIISRIISEGERIAYIVKSLLSFSRPGDEHRTFTQVGELLEDSISLTESALRKDGIKLNVNIPLDLSEVRVQSQEIQQVFFNILNNSRYALNQKYEAPDENKALEIYCCNTLINSRPFIKIVFHDKGCGIPADLINKIKNPFFTTKPKGKGTGLGLSISHGIVTSHNGQLYFESMEGEYTKTIIELPAEEC